MATVDVHGHTAAGFGAVRDAFAAAFRDKPRMGAALAIRHHGETVVDLWAGEAETGVGGGWRADTPSVIFSCTKGLMSILAARLVQEGRLDYESPVARYWPEFGVKGKELVSVGDLLAHRAGLSAPRVDLSTDDIVEWNTVTSTLAGQKPLWHPGSAHSYHAITHGWLAGELVRRVAGMSAGRYFDELVASPLEADAWIGLPDAEQARVTTMIVGPSLHQHIATVDESRPIESRRWEDRAMTLGGALPPALVGADEGFNSPRLRAAEIPGAGGVATARALATIWSATITETDGHRLLDSATVGDATTVRSKGQPLFAGEGPWPRWGAGFQLDSGARRYPTPGGFGHDGAGGQSAFADPNVAIGFAFLTNQMEAGADRRATDIIDALKGVVGH